MVNALEVTATLLLNKRFLLSQIGDCFVLVWREMAAGTIPITHCRL